MRNYFTLAGRDSRDFGVYISGHGTFSAPEKAYTFYDVPGRNGAILGNDHRLANIEVSYECFIYTNFNQNIADFRTFLLSLNGYQQLTDSYHPDEYRMAVYVGPFEPEVTQMNDAGAFTLTFNCKPQRYLYSGDASYTWVPGGDQGVTGFDLSVYTPRLEQSFLEWSFSKHGRINPNLAYQANVNTQCYSTDLFYWRLCINGGEVYSPYRSTNYIQDLTDVTIYPLTGDGIVRAMKMYVPDVATFVKVDDYTFRGDWTYFKNYYGTDIDHIIDCNWFKPVSSLADMSNYDWAVYYDSPYLYIKNHYTSTLDSFKSWYQNYWPYIDIDIEFVTPFQIQLSYTFVPNYPSPSFRLSESGADGSGYAPNQHSYFTIKYTGSDSMSNPTMFPSEPLIRVYGTGNFEMDGVTVTITTCTSYTDIDCELMDCYEGSTNRNNAVIFSTYDFPKLQPGDNQITITTGISAVEITPRWWRV